MLAKHATRIVSLIMIVGAAQVGFANEPTPSEIFDQRIMPIFRSTDPSSCVQCHLSSVDLKNYILPSQEKTFASLRDQGLIDLAAPEKSKILTLIRMGDKDLDKGARLIHETTRKAEYGAFESWIKACCADSSLRNLPPLSGAEKAGPDRPDEVIRHARKSRVADSFVRNIWSQRMRCFPCHTPHEIDPSNPRHKAALKTQREFKEKYSEEVVKRLEIFRETPEATMQYLIERSQQASGSELPLIDLENPSRSLIVLKPTSKLPKKKEDGTFEPFSSIDPVTHMGGMKMHRDDQSYKSFIAWLQDYSNVVGGRYKSVEDLPADNWFGSKLVLKLKAAPDSWPVGVPVQMFVHAWDTGSEVWQPEPIAFTQGTVTPRRMVNGALFLLASRSENSAKPDREVGSLKRGKYMIKVYVDSNRRVAKDPALLLGSDDFYGQVELSRARWREGFRQAESISGKQLKSE